MYIVRDSKSKPPKLAPSAILPPRPQEEAPLDQTDFKGAAEPFRQQAKMKLLALRIPEPTPTQVELTALTLAEKDLKINGGTQPQVNLQGFALQTQYLGRMAAAGLGVTGANAPLLAQILSEFDSEKLFTPLAHCGNNHFHQLGHSVGDLYLANQAAGLESYSKEYEIPLAGLYSSNEQASVNDSLKWLEQRIGKPNLRRFLNTITINTFLGETTDREGRSQNTIAGLSDGPNIALERAYLNRPNELRHFLSHEFGHSIDVNLSEGRAQYRTDLGDTPFGTSKDPDDCASPYATLNAREDFADTHAFLMENWSECRGLPQIALHGRGLLGDKMAWVLQNAYGLEVPPKSPRTEETVRMVGQGDSPFGWVNHAGQVMGAKSEYQAGLRDLLKFIDPKTGQVNSEAYLHPANKDLPQRSWLYQRFFTESDSKIARAEPVRVEDTMKDLKKIGQIDSRLRTHKSDAQELKDQKSQIGLSIRRSLERGREPFFLEVKGLLEQTGLDETYPQLGTYLELARGNFTR